MSPQSQTQVSELSLRALRSEASLRSSRPGKLSPALHEGERLKEGDLLAGRYRVIERIARGSLGQVYRAHDHRLDMEVALKFLLAPSSERLSQPRDEVKLARRVTHPAVCRVFDLEEADGESFVTMEYVDGEDLSVLLQRVGRLAPEKVRELGLQILDGLAAAHDAGVLHRDLKPANVLIDQSGRARIVDFGIATLAQDSLGLGLPVGSPAYMAPEQLFVSGPVSARADLYALGAVLYELLTGHPPDLHALPPLPPSRTSPGVDPDLERAILQALAKDPAERPASARAMAAGIRGALSTPAARTPAVATAAEWRPLAVLYCRRADFGALGRVLDAERARELVGEHATLCRDVIERYGGHVATDDGSELLAFFGFPRAHGDSPERALRAALRLRQDLDQRYWELERGTGQRLELGIAIDAGPAIVDGEGDAARAVGEPIDVARKLVRGACERSVLASSRCLALLSSTPETGETRSYDLGSARIQAAPVHAAHDCDVEHESTPFVGRQAELSLLRQRWSETVEGQGGIVLISGEAGIGKSRLIRELRRELAGTPHAWMQTRCTPYTSEIPLYPVAAQMAQLFGITSYEPAAERRAKLQTGLEQMQLSEAAHLATLEKMLSLEPSAPGKQLSDRELVEVLETFGALSAAAPVPVVSVSEDMHWADPSSLQLMRFLAQSGLRLRVLALFSSRSEFDISVDDESSISVGLRPLGASETSLLVEATGATLPQAVRDRVAARSGGNPLFAEQLTSSLLDRPAQGDAVNAIPPRLADVLAARLDELGPAKRLAQVAAVLGQDFRLDLLCAVEGLDESTAREQLDQLLTRDLIYRRATAEGSVYVFKQTLLRDAARQSLLEGERKRIHERLVQIMGERDLTSLNAPA